jgi:hypothetical protein
MRTSVDILVDAELERPDWNKIRDAGGMATKVPEALRAMLASESSEQVEGAYWKLDNVIAVQGQLFEAAAFVVPVLVAALLKSDRPIFVRVWLLELLFQIVNGEPHLEEEARGLGDLDKRCKDLAREGLWLVYREVFDKDTYNLACEIIRLLDDDNSRLAFIEARRK